MKFICYSSSAYSYYILLSRWQDFSGDHALDNLIIIYLQMYLKIMYTNFELSLKNKLIICE